MTSNRSRLVRLVVVAVGAAPLTLLAPAAQAAPAPDLAAAMLRAPAQSSGASFQTLANPSGASTLVATTPLAGFPTDGSSFTILSSGDASRAYGVPSDNASTSLGGGARTGGQERDVTVLKVDVTVPAGVNCMTGVDFRFLSEEFPEWVNKDFNDSFVAELDRTTWTVSGTTVSAPDNFAFDSSGDVVSVNTTGNASMTAADAAGTAYDGATAMLHARTPITPGPHSIYFSVFDVGDQIYDSAVLLDDLRFGTVGDPAVDCSPGLHADPARALVSTGVGTAVQTVTPATPSGGSFTLLAAGGTPVTQRVVPGVGRYRINGAAIEFTPVLGFSGPAPAVGYRITDGSGQASSATYVPTVTKPPAAPAVALTSTGKGSVTQTVRPTAPTGGSISLRDGNGQEVETLVLPGKGRYLIDPSSGTVSFVPAVGFLGTAPSVTFVVEDAYGQQTSSSYTPTVTLPPAPDARSLRSRGPAGLAQQADPRAVVGGSVRLLDRAGLPVSRLTVPGRGTFRVAPATGVLVFAPARGLTGSTVRVHYRLTDGYGQSDTSSYVARVGGRSRATLANARRVRTVRTVPTVCRLTEQRARSCAVRAVTRVGGRRVLVGTGSVAGAARSRVAVPVRLNALGRALAARPGGVRVALSATVRGAVGGSFGASSTGLVVAPTVALRTVYFDTDSASLRPADRAYLARVRSRMGSATSVVCTGYADARATVTYNAALARERARSACQALTRGLRVGRHLVSKGERRPVASNATLQGRALNRRVEVRLRY